jgi:hypothetical protein
MNTAESTVPVACIVAAATSHGIRQQLLDLGRTWLTQRAGALLREADDLLFGLAVNSKDCEAQNRFFDAMRALRTQRPALLAAWDGEFTQHTRRLLAGSCTPEPVLTAISGYGDSEPTLLVDAMLQRAAQLHAGAIGGLGALFSAASRSRLLPADSSRFGSATLMAACFAAACRAQGVTAPAYAALLPLFERVVLQQLEDLFARAAGVLLDAGLEAEPAMDAALDQAMHARSATATAERDCALNAEVFAALRAQIHLAPRMSELLGTLAGYGHSAAASGSGFPRDATHPLRLLLEEIVLLATGWEEARAPADDPILGAIARIVAHLQDSGNYNSQTTERMLLELRASAARERQLTRLSQRRAEDVEHARWKRASLDAVMERAFSSGIGGRALPEAVTLMLREGWLRVMRYGWMHGGEAGELYREALHVVDEVAALCKARAQFLPQDLLERMRLAMTHAGCDPLRIDILLQSASDALAAWEAPRSGAGAGPVADPSAMSIDFHTQESPEQQPADIEIARGSWFSFSPAIAGATRGRLALRLQDPPRLLFVDRGGNRIECLDLAGFARMLADGSAAALPEADIFGAVAASELPGALQLRAG